MAEPYLIRLDGTVLDRESGEVCGRIYRINGQWCQWGNVGHLTRRAAAEALYRRWKETR